jgi:hypothetical protein
VSLDRLRARATAALGPDTAPPGAPLALPVAQSWARSKGLRAALEARAEVGVVKYARPLTTAFRFAVVGAWQESVDLVGYLAGLPGLTDLERDLAVALAEALTTRVAALDGPATLAELADATNAPPEAP